MTNVSMADLKRSFSALRTGYTVRRLATFKAMQAKEALVLRREPLDSQRGTFDGRTNDQCFKMLVGYFRREMPRRTKAKLYFDDAGRACLLYTMQDDTNYFLHCSCFMHEFLPSAKAFKRQWTHLEYAWLEWDEIGCTGLRARPQFLSCSKRR
jgi:hypothetical protein